MAEFRLEMMMGKFVLLEKRAEIATVTLNRPEVLNAWHSPMRVELIDVLRDCDADDAIRAVILTGAGDRAFGAGQDFRESKSFDAERGAQWVTEWDRLYDAIRSLYKPLIAALNGIAAGSAFQVALLCDFRVGHQGVKMGQPEIKSGIPSTTGPWIMREHLGLARTVDLTLSGRLMEAAECHAIGLINRLVAQDQVMPEAIRLAHELAAQPPIAMRLDKQRFREITEPGFRDCLEAGQRIQREAYQSGEPTAMMERFLAQRAARKTGY